MSHTVTRRSLLSGLSVVLGAAAAAPREAAAQEPRPVFNSNLTLSIPFAPDGGFANSVVGRTYLERVVRTALVPPLSDVVIYVHGWLTDADDLMVIYDVVTEGYTTELRALLNSGQARAGGATRVGAGLVPPTSLAVLTTHWQSRLSTSGPVGVRDLLAFAPMEARAGLVGRTGMAHLVRLIWDRLLEDPTLASTRLHLIGHSFGARVVASTLGTLAESAPQAFTALQTRTPIQLVMLQPAMPNDALDPTDFTQAHPYSQLANYENLRVLVTMSRLDGALARYAAEEAVQPSDPEYAGLPFDVRKSVPALGAAGPSTTTWRAFNGDQPRSAIPVGPGFHYTEVLPTADRRLVVADLTPLHAAHRREDEARPAGEVPPFGRPERRTINLVGYHNDVYSPEAHELVIGFLFGDPPTGASLESS